MFKDDESTKGALNIVSKNQRAVGGGSPPYDVRKSYDSTKGVLISVNILQVSGGVGGAQFNTGCTRQMLRTSQNVSASFLPSFRASVRASFLPSFLPSFLISPRGMRRRF